MFEEMEEYQLPYEDEENLFSYENPYEGEYDDDYDMGGINDQTAYDMYDQMRDEDDYDTYDE